MKELELTLRVRNNRLKERRVALAMTQGQFAAAAGISLNAYRELEAMRAKPQKASGDWRSIATALATFHCVDPGELFPDAVLKIDTPVSVRTIDGADIARLIGSTQSQNPHELYENAELNSRISAALESIPPRFAKILRMKFGLDDDIERSTAEIGAEFGVTVSRVHQLSQMAISRLRAHRVTRPLVGLLP